jgi:LysR family transcriptional regulator for metE and metH
MMRLPIGIEVRDLRLIVAVAAEGSLTRAGARLNVTQPALSRHLATLEHRVGAPLFMRLGVRMQPTPAGELFLRHARDLLERVAVTETELTALQGPVRRVLRVGTDCYTGYHWLPGVANRFAARHPDVDVQIAFDAVGDPVAGIRRGAVDVALVTDGGRHAGLASRRLFMDEYVAVVAPSHRFASRAFIEPRDLATERLLLLSAPESSTVMEQFVRPARVKPRSVADVQLIGAVAALAESEYGVGITPNWTIAPEVRAGRLVSVRLGRSGFRRFWTAVMSREAARESALQDFTHAIAADGPAFTAPVRTLAR